MVGAGVAWRGWRCACGVGVGRRGCGRCGMRVVRCEVGESERLIFFFLGGCGSTAARFFDMSTRCCVFGVFVCVLYRVEQYLCLLEVQKSMRS